MTTAELTTTDALLADIAKTRNEIQKAYAAMPDVLDLPGSLTERQKRHDAERRHQLPQHTRLLNTLTEQVTKSAATCNTLTPARDRLLAARATIAHQLDDAPDYNAIVDRRESTREWERQSSLHASLTAIDRGVEFFGGQPALPTVLRALLSDTCASCGHVEVMWPGPLGTLEEKIERAQQVIASATGSLAKIRTSVKPWLTETVSG